ncbi:glycosyltransferase family 39 protein [Candidatus Marsarchaeota archaeon]|nr:glycosyltransferase family 39 protein [Candidatus Marsarchaeota archaeon]MCL5092645.1 glycosyltransferase family 39 protein [Candidatus Marsarchaeota archaeon]
MKSSKTNKNDSIFGIKRSYVVYGMLFLILLNAAHYGFTHYEGPSLYGDDPNYLYLASSLINGNYHLSPGYIFSLRLMQFGPIALFYGLFGVNTLTSSLWDIVSYLGIILVVFYLVKLFYNDKAALMSAFIASIFPLLTKFGVTVGEDPALCFVGSLAILLFIYGEKFEQRKYFFASGMLLVASWLISYEAGVVIAFLGLYIIIRLLTKKLTVNRISIMFIYGIAIAFLITFVFSAWNAGLPFITVTRNLGFYSAVGTRIGGLPTIPSTNVNLDFYPNMMFPYSFIQNVMHSNLSNVFGNILASIYRMPADSDYGLYFYLVIPILALLLIFREKRVFFIAFWFLFMLLFMEFGPMHVGLSLNPLHIIYIPAYRLGRFLMVMSVPLSAIIGIGLTKLIEVRDKRLLAINAIILFAILGVLYTQNLTISYFWYYWDIYPQSLAIQPANYLRYNGTVDHSAIIYVDALYKNASLSYTGSEFPSYIGDPSTNLVNSQVNNQTSCNAFDSGSYAVWSGPPLCSNWVDIFNDSPPKGIPEFFIKNEGPELPDKPTNIYYIK